MTDDAEKKRDGAQPSEDLSAFDLPEMDETPIEAPFAEGEPVPPPDLEGEPAAPAAASDMTLDRDMVAPPPADESLPAVSPAEMHVRQAERPQSVKGKFIAIVVIPLAAVAIIASMVFLRGKKLENVQEGSMKAAVKFMKGMSGGTNDEFIAAVAALTPELKNTMDIEDREAVFKKATDGKGRFLKFTGVEWVVRPNGVNYDEFKATAVFENGTLPARFHFKVYTDAHLVDDYRIGGSTAHDTP